MGPRSSRDDNAFKKVPVKPGRQCWLSTASVVAFRLLCLLRLLRLLSPITITVAVAIAVVVVITHAFESTKCYGYRLIGAEHNRLCNAAEARRGHMHHIPTNRNIRD